MRPLSDRQPPFPRPTWHRQRVCALHFPQGNRSSDTTHRLFSWSASGTHWSNHGSKALAPGKSRLDRGFYPARWWSPGLDGVSICGIGHHAISSAISQRVCAVHPCGWPPSRERLPAGLLSRWAPYGAERSPSFPPPITLNVITWRTHQSTILVARRGAANVRSIIDPPPAPRLNVKSLPWFSTIRSFLAAISPTKISPATSTQTNPASVSRKSPMLKSGLQTRILALLDHPTPGGAGPSFDGRLPPWSTLGGNWHLASGAPNWLLHQVKPGVDRHRSSWYSRTVCWRMGAPMVSSRFELAPNVTCPWLCTDHAALGKTYQTEHQTTVTDWFPCVEYQWMGVPMIGLRRSVDGNAEIWPVDGDKGSSVIGVIWMTLSGGWSTIVTIASTFYPL